MVGNPLFRKQDPLLDLSVNLFSQPSGVVRARGPDFLDKTLLPLDIHDGGLAGSTRRMRWKVPIGFTIHLRWESRQRPHSSDRQSSCVAHASAIHGLGNRLPCLSQNALRAMVATVHDQGGLARSVVAVGHDPFILATQPLSLGEMGHNEGNL